jgi:hypothetical protein
MKSGLLIAAALLITNLSSLSPAHADQINVQEIMRHKDVGVAIVTVTDNGTGADDQIKSEVIKQAGNENQICAVNAPTKR